MSQDAILVTGCSGFLGWNLCETASRSRPVVGLYHRNRVHSGVWEAQGADLTDFGALRVQMESLRPAGVIHTAALSQPNDCERMPELSLRINVQASVEIARLCATLGIPFVFTSTDLVFDGNQPPYREDSPISPLSIYGKHKAQAEQAILQANPKAAICRMPLMYGPASPRAHSFVQPWLEQAKAGKTLQLFIDEFRTPLDAFSACRALLQALDEWQGCGILHLGGPESISRNAFGKRLLEAVGLPLESILPTRQADVPMAAVRPKNVTLDTSKARGLGFTPTPLDEALVEMAPILRRELESRS